MLDAPVPVILDGPLETIFQSAQQPRFFVVVSAYEYPLPGEHQKPRLLWRAKLSAQETSGGMDEVIAALIAKGAPYFGKDMQYPTSVKNTIVKAITASPTLQSSGGQTGIASDDAASSVVAPLSLRNALRSRAPAIPRSRIRRFRFKFDWATAGGSVSGTPCRGHPEFFWPRAPPFPRCSSPPHWGRVPSSFSVRKISMSSMSCRRPRVRQTRGACFFEAYKQDQSLPYEKAMDLTTPPSWGKTVSASTHGTVQYHPSLAAGFACRISVDGLAPDHDYFLTLGGNPELPGNDLLLSQVPGTTQRSAIMTFTS